MKVDAAAPHKSLRIGPIHFYARSIDWFMAYLLNVDFLSKSIRLCGISRHDLLTIRDMSVIEIYANFFNVINITRLCRRMILFGYNNNLIFCNNLLSVFCIKRIAIITQRFCFIHLRRATKLVAFKLYFRLFAFLNSSKTCILMNCIWLRDNILQYLVFDASRCWTTHLTHTHTHMLIRNKNDYSIHYWKLVDSNPETVRFFSVWEKLSAWDRNSQ